MPQPVTPICPILITVALVAAALSTLALTQKPVLASVRRTVLGWWLLGVLLSALVFPLRSRGTGWFHSAPIVAFELLILFTVLFLALAGTVSWFVAREPMVNAGPGTTETVESQFAYYSRKAGDLSRQLGLAALALIWLFHQTFGGKEHLPGEFTCPIYLIMTSLAIDAVQYIVGMSLWGGLWFFDRSQEPGNTKKSVAAVMTAFISIKLAIMLGAYVLLLSTLPNFVAFGSTPRTPAFSMYPANTQFQGPPKPVRLATAEACRYRTLLKKGAAEGPNFAGHYRLVEWECGKACHYGAIVDLLTGNVSFLEATSMGWAYRVDSRLLAANPSEECHAGTSDHVPYFSVWSKWDGNRLIAVDSTRIRTPCG